MQKSFGNARNKAEQFSAATKNISVGAQQAGKAAAKAAPKMGKFAQSIARIAKYRMIRAVIRGIVDAIKEGAQNFYNFTKESGGKFANYAAALDKVKSASAQMKNQLGAAFGTLFTNIAPIITKLINLATSLANVITMLFARLSGAKGWYRATEVGADAASEAISGTGEAAKKAMKYLAPFDELNVLPSNDNSGGGGGGGSGGGGGGGYEWVSFEDFDIADGIKEIFDKITEAFSNAAEWLENIDWQNLGRTVFNKLKETLISIDWGALVSSIFEFLGAALGAAAGLIVGFTSELWTLIKTYFMRFIDEDSDGEWCALDIVKGIFKGLYNILENAVTWFRDYVLKPFIEGFKKAFGIASPAKEMEGPGEMVGEGILAGIAKPFKAVGTWIKNNILDPIKKKLTDGKTGLNLTIGAKVKDSANKAIDKFKAKWDSLKDKTATLTANLKGAAQAKFDALAAKWSELKTKAATLTANLTNNVKETVISKLTEAWEKIKSVKATLTAELSANKTLQTFVDLWNKLGDKAITLKADISQAIRDKWNGMVKSWNGSALGKILQLPELAKGGMLNNAGQIFIARESGPELVGSFGNKTGVMNNDQIVTAVANGIARVLSDMKFSVSSTQSYSYGGVNEETLYRAMLRALNAADREPIEIDIDGEPIYRGVVNRNRKETFRTGVNPMMSRA